MQANLIHYGGLAAISAGVLRAIASIVPATSARIMLLYLVIDVLLLFGSIGLHAFARQEVGFVGGFGVLLQVVGSLILIARDLEILSGAVYPLGALMFAAGLNLFAIGSWTSKKFPRWSLLLLIVSTLIGPFGFFVPSLVVLSIFAGMLFGVGFARAGMAVWLSPSHADIKTRAL